ncbi:MAG TPA: hypothetical protein VFE13_16420 [Caulobacteraceae bacterium]|nr:hypothetical protein [Caulobacteraceae bacterium]
MTAHVISSGVTTGYTLGAGDTLTVLGGGTSLDSVVGSGAFETVDAGAVASGDIVSAGGTEYIQGRSTGVTVMSGGVVEFDVDMPSSFRGPYSSTYTGVAGSTVTVNQVTIQSGGRIRLGDVNVHQHATLKLVSGVIVENLNVFANGDVSGSGELANSGSVRSGGSLEGLQIDSGAQLVVRGVATNLTVESGGVLSTASAGVARQVTISAGGAASLSCYIASGQTVVYSGSLFSTAQTVGDVTVESGGRLSLTELDVQSGGALSLTAPVTLQALLVEGGGTLAGPVTLRWGAFQDFGLISGAKLTNAAKLIVQSGGIADDVVVSVGAALSARAGAVVSGTLIENGGELWLQSGAAAQGVTVSNGGIAVIEDLLVASGRLIAFSGADVDATSTYGGVTVRSGATLDLLGVTVQNGATVKLAAGATISKATALSGATIVVAAGASVLNETIQSGGVLRGAGAIGGGVDHGVVSGVTVSGNLNVNAGGLTSRVTVAHGAETVGSGGLSVSAAILSGASEVVSAQGVASLTVVASGGSEYVAVGGVVDGLTLSGGATLIDNGTVRIGSQRTFAGALSGKGVLAVAGAGDLIVSGAGSAFTGRAVMSGGTLELAVAKAIGAGQVVFAATGATKTLQIDAADAPKPGDAFANTVSNFSKPVDNIDFRSIAFVSGATAVVSSMLDGPTLIITDGGHTYGLHLEGSIAASYDVTSDGHGGMLVTPGATTLVQAAAGFPKPGPASAVNGSGAGSDNFTPLFHAPGGRLRAASQG